MEYKWTVLTVTTVGVLMAGLDARIVVVGLPIVAQQIHAGAEEVVWVGESYLLSSTICLLAIGRISDMFGRVKLYNMGFVIFTIGSLLSSISVNSHQLIAFRAIQGAGSAILTVVSSAIITDSSPKNELGTMLGINQTAFRLGSVSGLTLSGLILSIVDWRGLFYVNIPIGIFGTIWAHIRLREIAVKDSSKKMDWSGLILFSAGLTLILLAITYLAYGLSSFVESFVFLFAGSFLMLCFIKIESTKSSPLLDFRLFKIRLFAMANIAQLLNAVVVSSIPLLAAFYLQIGLGFSPLHAGLGIVPFEVPYLIVSLVGGRLSDKYSSRSLCTLGLIIVTVSLFFTATLSASTQYLQVALILAFLGIGNGLFTAPNLKAIMASVPANRAGIASAFRNTMFQIGFTASYGLVVLLLTFGIDYSSLSMLLQNIGPEPFISAARLNFLDGCRIAGLGLSAINAIAIVPSAVRGREK